MAPIRAFENLDMAPTIYLVYIGFYITILSMILLMMGKGAIPKVKKNSPHKTKCVLSTAVGQHVINLRPQGTKLEYIIDCEVDENRQPILDRIRKNITCYMGNGVLHDSLSKAAETLFNRDYKDKKQIFVPECFLPKDPQMIFYEKDKLEDLINVRDDISPKEKGRYRTRRLGIAGDKLEQRAYDTLKTFFQGDQQVLVLQGFDLMDLDMPKEGKKAVPHSEKDLIVINATYRYVLNIEAKSTLMGKSITKAAKQLKETKKLFEKWFGADLNSGWVFISAVYCEKGHKCEDCDENFIFSGPEDLVQKLEKHHKHLHVKNRFVTIFPIQSFVIKFPP